MGLRVRIYRPSGEKEGHTYSLYKDKDYVTIVNIDDDTCENEPTEDAPGVKIIQDTCMGQPRIRAEPIEPVKPKHIGYMASGDFIYGLDSRFTEKYGRPISLFDLQETQEVYDVLSR